MNANLCQGEEEEFIFHRKTAVKRYQIMILHCQKGQETIDAVYL